MSPKQLMRIGLLLLVLAVFVLGTTVFDLGQLFRDTRAWFESLGWAGPVIFALIYGVLGALAAPTGLIELIAGAIFGFSIAAAAVLAGALMAANIGFACGRWLARDWVSNKMAGNRTAEQIEAAVEQRGFWITVLIRLSPAVPFNLTSYVLGASTLRWVTFLMASLLGMLPIKLFLVWIGASGQKLLGATEPSAWGVNEWLLYGGGLVATLLVVVLIGWTIARTSRRVLREAEHRKR
ncbi:VTT domain-containing protein [Salinisphaera sp. T31B1]|uniref:TVP38/TMEM64 family protein n=1 Tax=Salinisphaera sp. T31B1 TaxID=727963 RepID=UPI0033428652